uniref:Uncharacterized protein n=1 Tax=uncultured bacterium A1Q1_fos_500 TaxID=1256579 RepID=L7VWQ8_9BACT|nr:hypothetical protein [uncultured bacterium A1Q1_fos_500]
MTGVSLAPRVEGTGDKPNDQQCDGEPKNQQREIEKTCEWCIVLQGGFIFCFFRHLVLINKPYPKRSIVQSQQPLYLGISLIFDLSCIHQRNRLVSPKWRWFPVACW